MTFDTSTKTVLNLKRNGQYISALLMNRKIRNTIFKCFFDNGLSRKSLKLKYKQRLR